MRRSFFLVVTIALVLFMAGCGPAGSLFFLFVKSDTEFDTRLLGEWRMQDGASFQHGKKSGRIVFRKGTNVGEYDVTLIDFDEKGMNLAMTANVGRLGTFSFIDFGTPDSGRRKLKEIPFPTIGCHFFGRIHLEKDGARLDLLSDEWLKEQSKAGTLLLSSVQAEDGLVISAPTEELRKFALEHAEDAKAFSELYSLSRTK
jgi:hypothetical protein